MGPFLLSLLLNRLLTCIAIDISPYTYDATGRPGWGIAWYVNGTIIPELVVVRGRTYKFLIYGGMNVTDASNYHPFYITDLKNGGRLLNNQMMRMVCLYSDSYRDLDYCCPPKWSVPWVHGASYIVWNMQDIGL